MTIWPPDPGEIRRPAYRFLARSLIRAVEAGEVTAGERLPTHRDLAHRMGLSIQTISRAYEELIRLGIIVGEVGRGTYVRVNPVEPRTPYLRTSSSEEVIDCSMLKPVRGALHAERMRSALARLADDLPAEMLFSFRPRAALRPHRDTAVKWLSRCGITTRSDLVLLTNGNTPAMTIALMSATNPGDLVVTEELSHHTLPTLARYLGLRLSGLPADEQGLVPEAFENACLSGPVKALYVMPSGLNPLAQMMNSDRRKALCDIARRHDVLIVENDAWGALQPGRPSPIAARAPERTFYFTGFSKSLLPGLRLAYLVMPEMFVSAATNRHLTTNWMATPLVAEIATRWIEDETADELLEWQKTALAGRNRTAARILGSIPFNASPNGLHIWMPLPECWSEEALVSHARLQGVAIAPGSSFAIEDPVARRGVRVCLGAPSEAGLTRGLEVVARLLRSQPEPALLAI